MRIVRFGDYSFPDTPLEFNTNFADLVPQTDRLPGLDGGFDVYGDAPAPQEVGQVRYGFLLREGGSAGLANAIDELRAITRYGVKRLYMDTEGTATPARWQWARVKAVNQPQQHVRDGHESLRATVDWQVSDPRWFADDGEVYYDEGFLYDDGEVYDAGAVGTAVSGTASAVSVTMAGNAAAYPIIVIKPESGGTITNPTIARYVDGFLIDSLSLAGTATTGQFTIDCEALLARVNGANAYAALTYDTPWWMRLEPGANDIRVELGGTAQAGTVWFVFHDAWY